MVLQVDCSDARSGGTFATPPRTLRALVVVPDRDGPAQGGDSVVLRRVTAELRKRFDCDILTVKARRGSAARIVAMLRHQVPSEWAGYQGGDAMAAMRDQLSANRYDHVFILYEAIFHLAAAVPAGGPPVTLYAHNLPSQFAVAGAIVDPFLKGLAARAETRTFRQPGERLVMISQADRAAAVRRGLADADVCVAPPGAPPSIALAEGALFQREGVITGSYDWWRKRRDLKWFAATAGDHPVHVFDALVKTHLPSAMLHASMADLDWSGAIRLGVVTDRFGGGFKLKTLEYVARNCAIFSAAPVMAEFAHLPYAERFVFDNRHPAAFGAALDELAARDPATLRAEFRAFKTACCAYYSWDRCLRPLVDGAISEGPSR